MDRQQIRWLIYAIMIAAPSLIAWQDLFITIATDSVAHSLLASGPFAAVPVLAAALALPLLYVAADRLNVHAARPRAHRIIAWLYFFAAIGYSLNAIAYATFSNHGLVVYLWIAFWSLLYLPVTTIASVVLSPRRRHLAVVEG